MAQYAQAQAMQTALVRGIRVGQAANVAHGPQAFVPGVRGRVGMLDELAYPVQYAPPIGGRRHSGIGSRKGQQFGFALGLRHGDGSCRNKKHMGSEEAGIPSLPAAHQTFSLANTFADIYAVSRVRLPIVTFALRLAIAAGR